MSGGGELVVACVGGVVGVGVDVGFFVGVGVEVGFFVVVEDEVGRAVVVVVAWLVEGEVGFAVDVVVELPVVAVSLLVVSDELSVGVVTGETRVPEVSDWVAVVPEAVVDSVDDVPSDVVEGVVPVVPVEGMTSQADIKVSNMMKMAKRKTRPAEEPSRLENVRLIFRTKRIRRLTNALPPVWQPEVWSKTINWCSLYSISKDIRKNKGRTGNYGRGSSAGLSQDLHIRETMPAWIQVRDPYVRQQHAVVAMLRRVCYNFTCVIAYSCDISIFN